MPKALIAAALALLLVVGRAGPGAAEEGKVVVELFTSQGCSSCPPADEILRHLAGRDDVIALALHVDYWDYIGWADTFARADHTVRQKAYARSFGARMIYTPQMVIGGQDSVVGARPMEVMATLSRHAGQAPGLDLQAWREGERIAVRAGVPQAGAGAGAGAGAAMSVQLVRYRPFAEVDIKRGENAGRTLDYTNIVTAWDNVAEWSGAAPLTLDLPAAGDAPAVVIVQEAGPGAILAAVEVR